MEDLDKDYMLDQTMASVYSFKKAVDVVNQDKSKKKTPTQKLQYLTDFIVDEYERINKEYNKYLKP